MKVSATTAGPLDAGADTIAVGVFEGEGIAHDLPGEPLGGLLSSGEAGSEIGRLAVIHAGGTRFLLVGLGRRPEFTAENARLAAGGALARAQELRSRTLCWEVPHHVGDEIVAALVEGCVLRDYRFDRHKRPSETARPARVTDVILSAHHEIDEPVRVAAVIARAQNRVRDLANRPANDLTPTALANYADSLTEEHPEVDVRVIDESEIREMGMGAFAAVAQGSDEPAKLIRISYAAPGIGTPLTALVGKAVTFDSGGLWLKPSAKMHEMKFDMAGGATVIEAVATLAELRAPVSVLGIVGATENMISGGSMRPGDIVTALDGTTIEINNTDAEGRLVLGDCITYARREGAERIVDLATLTGGVVVALGSVYAGLMSNDEQLAAAVQTSSERTGELVWRLPLHKRYAQMVEGRYAQLTNLTERREAMAITAAEFLHHFAGDVPWAHLDIAGTSYDGRNAYIADKGATGYGLRLLVDLVHALGH